MHSTTTKVAAIGAFLAAVSDAQQVGTLTTETHPSMTWQNCTAAGSCTTVDGEITVDANWRWLHETSGSTNCYTGNEWNTDICTDQDTCTSSCAVDGAEYESTYGATTSDDALTLKFVTAGSYSTNIGSRMYLMNGEDKYQMFKLLGNEFTFDVDVSKLGCGLNGALYFVSMDEDGGMSKYSTNKAGAKYGTGYCDSQCPRDLKFIDGEANMANWTASSNDDNAGVGQMGSCCSEMDIWEANSISTAYTPHPCGTIGQHSCDGDNCGGTYSSSRYAGDCDPDGCDFNSYRQGNTTFFGPGMTVDTNSVFTVVTRFVTDSSGDLASIQRYYVQDGNVISNSESLVSGTSGNQIDSDFCSAQKLAFGDTDIFTQVGGMSQMGKALDEGMVLVMSLWDDHYSDMLWLDSTYPTDSDASTAGVARGTCSTTSGVPSDVESDQADDTVIYSNIRFGPIGSTVDGIDSSSSSSSSSSSGSSSSAAAAAAATTSKASTSTAKAATTSKAATTTAKAATTTKAAAASSKASTSTAKAAATTVAAEAVSAADATTAEAATSASAAATSNASSTAVSGSSGKTCKRSKNGKKSKKARKH